MILCDPEPKVQKSPPNASVCAKSSTQSQSDSQGIHIFYKMKNSDKVFSNDEFPMKLANKDIITKVWQESTIWLSNSERGVKGSVKTESISSE